MTSVSDATWLSAIRRLHENMRDEVVRACEMHSMDELACVSEGDADEGDTIYAIDRISEARLLDLVAKEIASVAPVVLVAEGLPGGSCILPAGAKQADATHRLIVDPIDGTRGLMYGKRSAWILTGLAPNLGNDTNLADVYLAVQTEIPLPKQHLCDTLWAIRGQGAHAERLNRVTGTRAPLALRPSGASDIAHGFATIARFFPGGRDILAAIDDDLAMALAGDIGQGEAYCFEDQYISTAGQMYELLMGHDRFVADLRPLLASRQRARGWPAPHACHPYDVAAVLIADEAGVPITDGYGGPLRCPLDVTTAVSWVGYANVKLRARIEPVLQQIMRKHGLLDTPPPQPIIT